MDISNLINIGDEITVSTSEGILEATEATLLFKDSPRARKYGILQGEYAEGEYVRSSNWNAIPIEVGKSYIMFLSDDHYESKQLFTECGRYFMWEYTDDAVYSGRAFEKLDVTPEKLIATLKTQISKRSGRLEEVGYYNLLDEIGEYQRAQAAKSEESAEIPGQPQENDIVS